MTKQKPLIRIVLGTYLFFGVSVAFVSMGSTAVYYGFGPGAIWNIGFFAWIVGGVLGMWFSFLRVVTWPYGLYVLINNPDGFFPWLFYLWYQ